MNPTLLSHGQKQLFCIARALLYADDRKKIVLMDEATSSVDLQTDSMIQSLIRKRFANHTNVPVAHRIETILDFDRVAVFHEGRLVEFDDPAKLRTTEGSMSKRLCDGRLGERECNW
jgi:ATP-binding cassette subfamily C (CFTR/MRP) protein 1